MNFTVIIPARYASTRLPGKPLVDIAGKPMVLRVLEQAQKSHATRVVVATDHQEVYDVVTQAGGSAVLTSEQHQSGTERLAEVIDLLNIPEDEIIVNVQGDEPLIPPAIIDQVAYNLSVNPCGMATLAVPINDAEELFNPNAVKVVLDRDSYAIYFSRAPIPWDRNGFAQSKESIKSGYLRHIGIYAYRANFIKKYINWTPSELEQTEMLEQLRVLWQGAKIHVDVAKETPEIGIDTQEDLDKVRRIFQNKSL